VSSFGRKRTPKSDKSFISTDDALRRARDDDEESPIKKKKAGPASKAKPAETPKASKAQPPAKSPKPTKAQPPAKSPKPTKAQPPAKSPKSAKSPPKPAKSPNQRGRKSVTREEVVFVDPTPPVRPKAQRERTRAEFSTPDVGLLHRHLRNIDCLTARTACLVCFIGTVNGPSKKRKKRSLL
jgi:hypothetical protein